MVRTPAGTGYGYTTVVGSHGIPGIPKKSVPGNATVLQKCWDFRDSTEIRILGFYLPEQYEINFYRYSPTPSAVLTML